MSGKLTKLARFFVLATSAGVVLSGCAGTGGGGLDESTFFADPATFAMYDCKQLANAREGLVKRVEELRGLMTKAETGAGGSVVAEIAYRPDYLSNQARLKSANAAWERNRCENVTDPALAQPKPGSQPTAGRSKGRVY
jgi:hypothetical protein